MYTGSLRERRKVNNKNQPHDNGGLHRTTGGKEMNATKLERKPNHAPEHTGRTAMCLCSETKMCQSCLLLREPASRFVPCGFCLSLSPVIVVFIRRRQRKVKPQPGANRQNPAMCGQATRPNRFTIGVAIRQLRGSGSTTPYSFRTVGRKEGILGFPPFHRVRVCAVLSDTRRDGRRETGTTGEETDVIVLRIRASRHAGQ